MPKAVYYFKLCGNIADKAEIKFAEMELNGLFPGQLNKIQNFVDVLSKPPLNALVNSEQRVQDVMMRDVCYGKTQGFWSEHDLTDISDLIRRLAYIREIYVLIESSPLIADNILAKLYPPAKGHRGNLQVFTGKNSSHLFRFIAHTYFYENADAAIYFSYAKTKQRMWERVQENIERLVKHILEDRYYIPKHPSSRMYKEVEDLFDERKEVKLYLSHAFGPPYKAKFHPRMVKALMNYIGIRDGRLLDPLVGSGTMSIECTLTGVDSVGIDISPVCVLATKAKISSLVVDPAKLREKIDEILSLTKTWQENITQQSIATFLRKENLPKEITIPKSVLDKYKAKKEELLAIYRLKEIIQSVSDEDIRNIFLCGLSKVVSEVLRAREEKNVFELFEDEIEQMWKGILAFNELRKKIYIKLGKSENFLGDARDLRSLGIEENSISGIITSPPYSTAVDYIRNDFPMLRIIHEANIDQLEKNMMGNPRFHDDERQLLAEINDKKSRFAQLPIEAQKKIHDLVAYKRKGLGLRQYKFLLDMKQALSEMHRVLKPNGRCVIVIGNNNFKVNDEEVEFRNAQYIYEMGPSVGFKQEDIIDRNLLKTSYGAIQKEHLLILRK